MNTTRYRQGPTAAREYLYGNLMLTETRLTFGLGPLIQVLEERGIKTDSLLAAAEIPRFATEEPSHRVGLDQELCFTRLALRELNQEGAGLLVGQRFRLSMFGVLGLAASCCETSSDAFQLMLSYPVLAWGMFRMSVWKSATDAVLRLDDAHDLGDCVDFFLIRDMACVTTLSRDALEAANQLQRVRLRASEAGCATAYQDFFRCEVEFGADANELVYTPDYFGRALPLANPMARRFYENQCRELSGLLMEAPDFVEMIRSRLLRCNPMPSLPALASELHLTERTLQRRLAAQGCRFSDLLRDVRMTRAEEYLRYSQLRFEQIAERLGFKDAVAFSHAFKTWTGISPRQYQESV